MDCIRYKKLLLYNSSRQEFLKKKKKETPLGIKISYKVFSSEIDGIQSMIQYTKNLWQETNYG